jgi:hypothetical protein
MPEQDTPAGRGRAGGGRARQWISAWRCAGGAAGRTGTLGGGGSSRRRRPLPTRLPPRGGKDRGAGSGGTGKSAYVQ